jgi:MFS-type transporter involved in bile tolerance (Atg22 family)
MADQTNKASPAGDFQALDDAKPSRFQLKIMFVSGMAFFTDAYDLFVIGIVVALLDTEGHLSTTQVSWLNSATLLASAFGAVIFGRIADMLGRKRIYGYEVLILSAGALASAFSPNLCVPAGLPRHLGHRHRRRLSGLRHDHERVLRQAVARPDGRPGLRDAGVQAWSSGR